MMDDIYARMVTTTSNLTHHQLKPTFEPDQVTPENRFQVGRIFNMDGVTVMVKKFDGLRLSLDVVQRGPQRKIEWKVGMEGKPIMVEGCLCGVRHASSKRLWLIIVETKEQLEERAKAKESEETAKAKPVKGATHYSESIDSTEAFCNAANPKNLTDVEDDVDCKRCLKKMEKMDAD